MKKLDLDKYPNDSLVTREMGWVTNSITDKIIVEVGGHEVGKDKVQNLMKDLPLVLSSLRKHKEKVREMFRLLLECRDALPAITMTSAKLRGIKLDLADRIEKCLEPWEVKEEDVQKLIADGKESL